MYVVVTSKNRGELRKVAIEAGHASKDVHSWPNGLLGTTLCEAIKAGRITEDRVRAAMQSSIPEPLRDETTTAQPAPVPTGDVGAQLKALLESLGIGKQQPIDVDTVREMVRAAIETERVKPAVIEIRRPDREPVQVDGNKHKAFATVFKIIHTRVAGRRCHVWLSGPSGSGKTTLAQQLAKAGNEQLFGTGAVGSKYDLVGFKSPHGDESTLMTQLRLWAEQGGIFLWDEIDASDNRALCAFNDLLANHVYSFPDKRIELHADCVAIGTANTWGHGATAEYVGRNPVDKATLDRFQAKVLIDYDETLERDLVGREGLDWALFVQSIRKAVRREGLKILVTPRATLAGHAFLQAGLSRAEVESLTVFAGLDDATVSRLRNAA